MVQKHHLPIVVEPFKQWGRQSGSDTYCDENSRLQYRSVDREGYINSWKGNREHRVERECKEQHCYGDHDQGS